MALVKRALSVVGKLGIVIAIAIAFIVGLTGTVYLSLRSPEVKVPDVVGKDLSMAESTLGDARLNMRKRATRYSPDAQPNMILDQSPRAGEVIKVGQTVAVVVSRAPEKDEAPPAEASKSDNNQQTENQNANAASEKNQNENQNKPKRNKNTNKNANNSNNANGNSNRSANNRSANANVNANAANRNLNANIHNANANTNRNATNLNVNRRPVISTPPVVNPSANRRIP